MVAAVREGGEVDARDSLRALCQRYWVPVYAYVRLCGHAPAAANRLVQHFLSHLVQMLRIEQSDIAMGFRGYLEAQLAEFLDSDAARRAITAETGHAGMQPPWPLEQIEQRLHIANTDVKTPSQGFHRAFALEMLANALERLRHEAEESGRSELFDRVRPFLSREPTQAEYDGLAAQMGSSQLAAIIAVKRLRQRFQELIDTELAQTVGDSHALESEKHTLLTIVSPDKNSEQRQE
jgi:RNA polymerase sigma-70 factor (ECF subfamily)